MRRLFGTAFPLCCLLLIASPSVEATAASLRDFSFVASGYGGGGRFTALAIDPAAPDTILVGSDVAGVFKSTDGGEHFKLAGTGLDGFAVADILFVPGVPGRVFLLTWDGLYMSADAGETWTKRSGDVRYRPRVCGSSLMIVRSQKLLIASDDGRIFDLPLADDRTDPCVLPGLIPAAVACIAEADGVLFAGTDRGVFAYRSDQWQSCSDGLPPANRRILDLAAAPGTRLFAVEETTGLHRYDARTKTWRPLGAPDAHGLPIPIQRRRYKALAVDPFTPGTLYVATHPETWPYALFRSSDNGTTWRMVSRFRTAADAARNWPASAAVTAVEQIMCAPVPGRLYMTDWWNVWKSTDAGETWLQLHRGLQNTVVNDIKPHPHDPSVLFMAVSDNGLMVSRDSGASWTRMMTGVADGHAQEVELSASDPRRMYLLLNPWEKKSRVFVYRSMDTGETWRDVGFSLPDTPLPRLGYVDGTATNLEIDPHNDATAYVATNGYGVFKTTDSGATWSQVNSGITSPYIRGPRGLLMHPKNPSILWVSTLGGGVYKTTDAGARWHPLPTGHDFTFGMALDPADPKRLFVCCPEKTLIRTSDGGITWQTTRLPGRVSPNIAAHAVCLHPRDPRIVFVGTLSYDYTASDGLFVSRDGGASFTHCPINAPAVTINVIEAVRSAVPRILIGFNGIGLFSAALPGSAAP